MKKAENQPKRGGIPGKPRRSAPFLFSTAPSLLPKFYAQALKTLWKKPRKQEGQILISTAKKENEQIEKEKKREKFHRQ